MLAYVVEILAPPNQPNVVIHKNQKLVVIKKPSYDGNFIQIGIEEWQYAAKDLKPTTMLLYMYLAGNRDDFYLALSHAAVKEATGMSKNTYHRAVEELIEKNYLVKIDGKNNIDYESYRFHTSPMQDD